MGRLRPVKRISRWLAYLVMFLVVAFGVLFSFQNTAKVPLDLLAFQFAEQSVSLWVLSAFALGGLIGVAISTLAILRLKSEQLLLQRKLDRQQKELAALRMPDLTSVEKTKALSTSIQ